MKLRESIFLLSFILVFAFPFLSCSDDTDADEATMELVLSFSGESATSVTLTYGASNDETRCTTATAAVSANKAAFSLSKAYADSYGYFKVYSVKAYSGSTLLEATTTETVWFKYNEDQSYTLHYTLQTTSEQSSVTIKDLSVTLGDDFIRGFDASEVDYYETDCGITWTDTDGSEKDFFEILAAHGVNTVRLRIWKDPSQFSASINTGMNDIDRTVRMARRAHEAGLDVMLDFHYSDTWADPGRQMVPAAWKNLGSVEAVSAALAEYTADVLTALKEQAGVVPRYVQVGNEINPGLLLHVSSSSTNNDSHTDFAYAGKSWGTNLPNFTAYIKAGADAVRTFDSSIKIVLHVASAGYEDWSWIFDPLNEAGVPFDIIGFSYYPWESSHGTISMLKKALAFQKARYGVDVIVAECSSHWADESSKTAQSYTYQHMVDPATGALYSDLETATSGSTTYVKGSIQNQANVIRHIIGETAATGGIGVFTWGGDLYNYSKWGMFNSGAVALPSLDVFSVQGSEP